MKGTAALRFGMMGFWGVFLIVLGAGAPASASSFNYRVFGDGTPAADTDLTTITTSQANAEGFAYVQMDSFDPETNRLRPEYCWGNIKISYRVMDGPEDAAECVSIEEPPDAWGFWTWWTSASANPSFGGGGETYCYGAAEPLTGSLYGGEWARAWNDMGYSWATPGSIDGLNNTVYMYASTAAGGQDGSVPLRLGFAVNSASPVLLQFTVSNNDISTYNWAEGGLSNTHVSYVTLTPPLPVDYIRIESDSEAPLLSGEGRIFHAVGYNFGPNGLREDPGAEEYDDLRVGPVDAAWKVQGDKEGYFSIDTQFGRSAVASFSEVCASGLEAAKALLSAEHISSRGEPLQDKRHIAGTCPGIKVIWKDAPSKDKNFDFEIEARAGVMSPPYTMKVKIEYLDADGQVIKETSESMTLEEANRKYTFRRRIEKSDWPKGVSEIRIEGTISKGGTELYSTPVEITVN